MLQTEGLLAKPIHPPVSTILIVALTVKLSRKVLNRPWISQKVEIAVG